jgi:hypothetical protein
MPIDDKLFVKIRKILSDKCVWEIFDKPEWEAIKLRNRNA